MEFCSKTADIWQLIGKAFLILKVVIPLLIIIFGIVNLSKAVLSGEDKAIKENVSKLIKRLIAGVVIFLVPTIIRFIFDSLSYISGNKLTENTEVCINCLVDPYNDCDTSNSGGIFKK